MAPKSAPIVIAVLAASMAAAAHAAPAAEKPERRRAPFPPKAYTLRELLERAEIIFVGKVAYPAGGAGGAGGAGSTRLAPEEVLKGKVPDEGLEVDTVGPPLPRGARAIWFLPAKKPGRGYVIDHPQCAYDVLYLSRVKAALKDPRGIGLQDYLREGDVRLARLIAERAEYGLDSEKLAARPVSGKLQLSVKAAPARIRIGGDLSVEFVLTNLGEEPAHVMNSVFRNFFLRVRRAKKGSPPLLLNQRDASVLKGLALDLGDFVNVTDFSELAPGRKLSTMLHYSPTHFPVLRGAGKLEVTGIYRVSLGRVETGFEPWRGTLVGESFTVEIADF